MKMGMKNALSCFLLLVDWRGETSEVFVVRRAANLLAKSIVSSKLVSSKPVSSLLDSMSTQKPKQEIDR